MCCGRWRASRLRRESFPFSAWAGRRFERGDEIPSEGGQKPGEKIDQRDLDRSNPDGPVGRKERIGQDSLERAEGCPGRIVEKRQGVETEAKLSVTLGDNRGVRFEGVARLPRERHDGIVPPVAHGGHRVRRPEVDSEPELLPPFRHPSSLIALSKTAREEYSRRNGSSWTAILGGGERV